MGIASKVGRASFWVAASKGLVSVISAVSTVVLARLLLPRDFGLVAIGLTMINIVAAVTDLSLVSALIQHESPKEEHLHCAWTLNALRGAILCAFFIAVGPLVAHFYHDRRLVTVMVVIGSSVFCSGLTNPKVAMLKRDLVFWQDFIIQVAQKLVMTVASIVFAVLYKSYVALLAGIIAGEITQVAVSYMFVPYRPRVRLFGYRDLIGFSGWLTLSQIVQTINWRLDPLIVGKFVGASQLGLFTVFGRLAAIPTRDTTLPLTATLFPALCQVRDDRQRLQGAAMRAQVLISAISLPCACLTASVAYPLVLLTMGRHWISAIYVLQILAVATAFQTLAMVYEPATMALGKTRLFFRRSLQLLAIRLPATVAGLYFGGLPGLMVALVFLAGVGLFLDMLVMKEAVGLRFRDQLLPHWRTVSSCCAMGGFSWLVGSSFNFGSTDLELVYTIILKGALAGTVYLVCLFGLWVLANKPAGAEQDCLRVLKTLLRYSGSVSRLAGTP